MTTRKLKKEKKKVFISKIMFYLSVLSNFIEIIIYINNDELC